MAATIAAKTPKAAVMTSTTVLNVVSVSMNFAGAVDSVRTAPRIAWIAAHVSTMSISAKAAATAIIAPYPILCTARTAMCVYMTASRSVRAADGVPTAAASASLDWKTVASALTVIVCAVRSATGVF